MGNRRGPSTTGARTWSTTNASVTVACDATPPAEPAVNLAEGIALIELAQRLAGAATADPER
jgi:hypothetical protein